MTPYASAADLDGWLPPDVALPDDAEEMLRDAAVTVAAACNRNPYLDVPTVQEAEVLKDATCAQVEAWIAADVRPASGGITEAPVRRSSILDATVERDTAVLAAAKQAAAKDIAPQARAILDAGGLLYRFSAKAPQVDTGLPYWGLPQPRFSTPAMGGQVTVGVDADGTIIETIRWP